MAAVLAMTAGSLGADYTETEGAGGNNTKATANDFTATPLVIGDRLLGTSTGLSTSGNGLNTADVFKVKTDAATLGVYRHTLTVTTVHTMGLRGSSDTSTDSSIQSNGSVTPRAAVWYGFGRGEEAFFQITGTSATTAQYEVTYGRASVTPQTTSTTFSTGPITISSIGQTTADTDFWVYDSNFDVVATFGNDDNTIAGGGSGSGSQSIATRTLSPGTYYVAISTFNLINNQARPSDERNTSTLRWDSANAISNSATSSNVNVNFRISDNVGNFQNVTATKVASNDVVFVQFTVGAAQTILITPALSSATITPGQSVTVSAAVTPAPSAPNTITSVTADLSGIGGSATQQLFDNATNGDDVAGDNNYKFAFTPPTSPVAPAPGLRSIAITVSDNLPRTVSASVQGTVAAVQPGNDTCASALALTSFPVSYTVGINQAQSDNAIGCSTALSTNNGVWFTLTAGISGILEVRETGSRDVSIVVYDGACGAAELACETDETDANFQLVAGQTYSILVTTPGSASTNVNDTYALSFNLNPTPAAPANDLCQNAVPLVPSASFQTFLAAGAGPDQRSDCQTLSSQPNESRNGIWFTYTTGSNDELSRFLRSTTSGFFSAQIYTGGCGSNLLPYRCVNLGTAAPGTYVPLRKNTQYFILVHRRSGYLAANAGFEFIFNIEPSTQVPNADCSTATPLSSLPFNAIVTNILAFDEGQISNCPTATVGDASGNGGVWYSYTATQHELVYIEEIGASDAAVTAFDACGGNRIACSLVDSDVSSSTLGNFRAYPGQTYYILISRQDSTSITPTDTLSVRITSVPASAPPTNDDCGSARVINSVPYTDSNFNAFATDDAPKVVCARGTITGTTRGAVWYSYTNGPAASAAIIGETTAQDAVLAVYETTCGVAPTIVCSDTVETGIYFNMKPNTTYFIVVAKASDVIPQASEVLTFTFDLVAPIAPPANDLCENAQAIDSYPRTLAPLPIGALADADPSCSGVNVAQATNGIWYVFRPASSFTLRVNESTTANNVMYTLYGACGGAELACQTTDTNRDFALDGGQTYYLLVAIESNNSLTSSAVPMNLTFTALPGTAGACCTGTTCATATIETCVSGFLPGGVCTPTNPIACCPVNFNQLNGVDVPDIFAFLAAWFADGPGADFDRNGIREVSDIFSFLAAWFAGCA